MAKTKIIEALKELPLIDKKIDKNISLIQQYSSGLDRGEDTDFPFETKEKQQKEIKSLIQSTEDLIRNRGVLRQRLAVTNAQVKVKIGNMEHTIAEWISLRQGGMDKLIHCYSALNDGNASNMLKTTNVDLQKGLKILRFYDEKERNEKIKELQEIKDKIDAQLEIVNATTDLVD